MAGFTLEDPVVPMNHPRVLVETAVAQGARMEQVLEGTGVAAEMLSSSEARISYLQFGALANNAIALTGNPALGLDFGRRLHFSNHGMVGIALLSSPTMGDAIETGLTYHRLLAPAWNLAVEVQGERAALVADPTIPFGPFLPFGTEALLTAIEALTRFLLGRPPAIHDVYLSYAEPAYSARYRELYDARFHFETAPTRVVFDASMLNHVIATADPLTAELARRQCDADLPPNVSRESLLEQVRRYVNSGMGAYPDIEQTARFLRTSSRSLRRALKRFGVTHQELVDEARSHRAIECLRTTHMTLENIAEHVGFRDSRSFRRAFRRWTGKNASEFRPPRTVS